MINKLIAEAVAGKKVVQLCALGDQSIEAGVAAIYTEKKEVTSKGIGFPTCISINNVVGHFSPYKDDATVLKDGDIVKMCGFGFFLLSIFICHNLASISDQCMCHVVISL